MKRAIKKQVLTVVERNGVCEWHSVEPGWVPHEKLEMTAATFPVGTKVTVKYGKEKSVTGEAL